MWIGYENVHFDTNMVYKMCHFNLQIEGMYKKAHAAIRENPEAKKSDKKPFKGKRCVDK